jgi:DNA-binding LacI/PurR family transcriptional regulator
VQLTDLSVVQNVSVVGDDHTRPKAPSFPALTTTDAPMRDLE